MQASASVLNVEDTKPEVDESAERKLEDTEESLAMRKLLVSLHFFCRKLGMDIIFLDLLMGQKW
jgi:hypothetical protein